MEEGVKLFSFKEAQNSNVSHVSKSLDVLVGVYLYYLLMRIKNSLVLVTGQLNSQLASNFVWSRSAKLTRQRNMSKAVLWEREDTIAENLGRL